METLMGLRLKHFSLVLAVLLLAMATSGCSSNSPYSKVLSDGHENHSHDDDDPYKKKRSRRSNYGGHNHSH